MSEGEKEMERGPESPKGVLSGSGRKGGDGSITQEDVIRYIENMTVLELSDLVKALEQRFGVSAALPVAAAPAGGPEPVVEEQTAFTVTLKAPGAEKIKVIKVVRALTGLGLKEAKAVVDEAPKAIKEGVSKEEAEDIKRQLVEVGAEVQIS